MALTVEQRATLAAHIRANQDQAVIDALAIRNDTELARLYNLPSGFYVWKSDIPKKDLRGAFVWDEVVTNLSATDWQAWAELTADGSVDGSDANIRAGFARIFTGPNVATTRANLLAIAKRFATVAEEVFATGTGTEANPGALVFEGSVSISDIGLALNENP